MLTSAQRSQLESVAAPNADVTLPPYVYSNDDMYAVEIDRLFQRGWVGVGRADQWANVGDCRELELGDVQVVITRTSEGSDGLRALSNSCLHRGMKLVSGKANDSRLRCPFHGWTYDLGGQLTAAPEMHRTPGFSKSDYCLKNFAIEERAGFVFVSIDPAPPPIDEWLAGFDELHAPWPLEGLTTTRRREFSVECNWKLFAEVFNEYYHLPFVHRVSLEGMYNDPDDPEEVAGAFATQFGLTNGTPAVLNDAAEAILPLMPGLSGRHAEGVRYTWLYPNIITAIGVEVVWMYEIYPDGPDRCQVAQSVCFPPETIATKGFEAQAEEYYRRFDVAIEEDIPVLEQQHLGLKSPFAEQGPINWMEPSVALFAKWYAENLLAD